MAASVRADVKPWTLVVLPDTQIYARKHPEHFGRQVDFILRHAEKHDVVAVLHEGDVVDDNSDAQWERAAELRRLEGHVPLVMALGNHDYGDGGSGGDRTTGLHRWFPFESFTTIRATFEPQRADNALHRIDTPEGPWNVVVLEFAPRDVVLDWARLELQRDPDTPTVVLTHTYLYSDHTRYDRRREDQRWAPWVYGVARRDGANDGEEIYAKLVEPFSQVRVVLCGHVINEGAALRTDVRADGTRVHQMLANYQHRREGGASFLRLLTFTEGTLSVRTYSPWLDEYREDERDQFELAR